MKKKLLAMLLAVVLAVGLLPGTALAFSGSSTGGGGSVNDGPNSCGSNLTWSYSDGVLSIDGTGYMWGFTADELPWRDYSGEIHTLAISDGVITIGTCAFCGFEKLTSATIPAGVTEIDAWAFSGCTSLTSVTIPVSVTIIESLAFYGCTSLTDVYYGGSESQWGAIMGMTEDWEDATFAEGGQEMPGLGGVQVHYNSTGPETEDPTETEEPGETEEPASGSCGENATWSYSDGTLTIEGTGAMDDHINSDTDYTPWWDVREEIKTVVIKDGITVIGQSAFEDCVNLTDVTIAASVTEFNGGAFYGCTGLTGITIPDGVTVIGWAAFEGCTGLTSVTIPASVTEIWSGAFYDCDGLKDVYYGGSASQWEEISIADGNDPLLSAGLHTTEAPDVEFTDVNESDWFYDDLQWAVKNSWVNGYPDGSFAPEDVCTEEEVLVLLYRAAGSPESDAELPDSLASRWNPAALRWALENDMIDETFDPNTPGTRAGVIYYLWQAYGSQSAGEKASFSDVDEDSPYIDALSWSAEAGIVGGYPNGTFAPNGPFERAHLVRVLHLTVDLLTGE